MRIARNLAFLVLVSVMSWTGQLKGFDPVDDYAAYWEPVCDGLWNFADLEDEWSAQCVCSSSSCEIERDANFIADSGAACEARCDTEYDGVDRGLTNWNEDSYNCHCLILGV